MAKKVKTKTTRYLVKEINTGTGKTLSQCLLGIGYACGRPGRWVQVFDHDCYSDDGQLLSLPKRSTAERLKDRLDGLIDRIGLEDIKVRANRAEGCAEIICKFDPYK